MVHAVVAFLRGDFLRIDAIFLFDIFDRLLAAGGAAQVWIEARQIILHHRSRVALGIDRDEQRVDAVGVLAQGVHHFRQLEKRGRANVGAVGVAEEYQEGPAFHVLVGDRLAVFVDQLERPADRRCPGTATAAQMAGRKQDDAEKDDQTGQESRENNDDMRCPSRHCHFGSSLKAREPAGTHDFEEYRGSVIAPKRDRCRHNQPSDEREQDHQRPWMPRTGCNRGHVTISAELFVHIGPIHTCGNNASCDRMPPG